MPLVRARGGGQLPFLQTIREGVAAAVPSANTAYLHRFRVAKPTVIGAIAFFVGGASGNVDVGIFSSADLATFTLLTSSGTTAVAGTNANQKIAFSAIILQPGIDYFLAIVADNGTVTIGRVALAAGIAAAGSQVVTKGSLFPLATFSTPGATDREIYLIGTAS